MSYTGRKVSSTSIYHVMARGINHEKIFLQIREKQYFIRILKTNLEKYGDVEIYAFCIMPTHIHILIKAEIQMLSSFMAIVLAEYAEYYNYKHKRNGHVFQGRFKSECVENIQYFWTCLRYIHMNPQKANVVNNPKLYKFSSMREYLSGNTIILHEKAIQIYERDFDSTKLFEEFHQERQNTVFMDIQPEIHLQKIDIATSIIYEMQIENELEQPAEILEYKSFRELYLKRLKTVLDVSDREIHRIYLEMKDKIL